jgi:opine dehydrogenase
MGAERVTVIGGGNGALAFAAYFGLRGLPVRLWEFPDFRKNLDAIYREGRLVASGTIQGEAPVECHEDLGVALRNATIIMVVVPASAHLAVAEQLAPLVRESMTVVLNPGRTGGALEVAAVLRRHGVSAPVAETQTLLFACRRRGEREIHIGGIKALLRVGIFPAVRTGEVAGRLTGLCASFRPVPNVLTTGLGNIGAMFHPASALLNIGLIESGKPYDYYPETMSPTVAKVIERADAERMAIARALGADVFSAVSWLAESYQLPEAPLHEMLQGNPAYRGIAGPTNVNVRYITEDVPTGLVPMEALGRLAGVPTPTISALIDVARAVTDLDFRATGRTLERLGLAGLSGAELAKFVERGERF